jgi:two-component system response regulator CpxR
MHEPVSHLLFISPDANKSNPIGIYLENEGYHISHVKDGSLGLKMMRAGKFDLILINILLPNVDGFEVLKQVRQSHVTPVILLSDKDEEFERVYGLELGADDYVARPLSHRELLARIRARLRREEYATNQLLQPFINAGRLSLDTSARTLALDHKLLNLTDAEFGIAEILIMNKGQVVSKHEISRFVFKRPLVDYDRSIDMHLSTLRKKLAHYDGNDLLRTIRGSGYMLVQKWV